MELDIKLRITHGGEKIFGKGPCILLEAVDKLGSLNKASRELNISYSKAWTIINRAEKALGYSLLKTKTGGMDGGGSVLTPEAINFIEKYKAFSREVEDIVRALYENYFG